MAKLLGIMRSEVFSPNMTKNDLDIFMAVVKRLEERELQVDCLGEDELVADAKLSDYDLVFTMLRGSKGVMCLKEYGLRVTQIQPFTPDRRRPSI